MECKAYGIARMLYTDNDGNLETMQKINAEYDRLFKILKDKYENSNADRAGTNTYFYSLHNTRIVSVCYPYMLPVSQWLNTSAAAKKNSYPK